MRAWIVLVGLACGCPGSREKASEDAGEKPSKAELAAKREAVDRENRQRGIERRGEEQPRSEPDAPLEFEEIVVVQDSASIDSEVRAKARLVAGSSPFADVKYVWSVAGREVTGWTLDTLAPKEGRWKAGDWIEVRAVAKDEKGRTANSKIARIQVGNSTPIVLTDLRSASAMSGVQMEATDPDGDALSWSMKAPVPPGVSITPDGWIRVAPVNVKEEWKGEAVFVVADPKGARAEVHVPMTVSAATDAKQEKKEVQVRVDSRTLTDEEMIRHAEEQADRYEKMSDEEVREDVAKGEGD